MVDQKTKYLNSSTKEYETRSKTTANAVQLFKNQLGALGIVIGSALLPALTSIMETLGPIIKRMADFAEAHPALTRVIVATVAGLVALRVAAIAAQFSLLWMRGGMIAGAIGGMRVLSGVVRGLGLAFLPLRLYGRSLLFIGQATAMAAAGNVLALRSMRAAALAMANPMRVLRVVAIGLRTALLFSGVGLVLAGIAAAGTFIYNNWDGVKAMIQGVADGFMAGLGPVMPVIQPIVDAVKSIWDSLTGLVGPLATSTGEWRLWGEAIGGAAAEGIKTVIEAIRQVIGYFGQAYEKAKSVADAIRNWGSGYSGGAASASTPAGSVVGPGGAVISGARAAGGPVVGGRTYLVGEEGPEIFTASRSGTIIPNHQLSGGASPGGGRSVSIGAVHVHAAPGMSEEGLARKVLAMIERQLRDDMDGVQADIEYGVA
ncbi:phage tail tape measure protein [Phyllobacterium phragmitis]|uniref:Phage tail tape measure protein n=1 Tax=Phyllobacterium phragmitis TaxID=2670329 RepID=A0A2S9IK16_9HYPH|nr:phage tail tape measure protein [Phyllobacterium phragmitis]